MERDFNRENIINREYKHSRGTWIIYKGHDYAVNTFCINEELRVHPVLDLTSNTMMNINYDEIKKLFKISSNINILDCYFP